MAFKLKKGVFRVACKHPGCPFDSDFEIPQNIMGVTEDDIESEAKKIAKDMAQIKHDALYGRKHHLTNSTIRKVTFALESIGAKPSSIISQHEAVKQKEYKKGEIIIKKGDVASTICEVIKGKAHVDQNPNPNRIYTIGNTFGAAALLVNQKRTADVIAAEDGTIIAFYNLKELSKKDAKKGKELYTNAMEDIFDVIMEMEQIIDKLDSDVEKGKMAVENYKQRVISLERDLLAANQKLADQEK
jgi:hypothetical protein